MARLVVSCGEVVGSCVIAWDRSSTPLYSYYAPVCHGPGIVQDFCPGRRGPGRNQPDGMYGSGVHLSLCHCVLDSYSHGDGRHGDCDCDCHLAANNRDPWSVYDHRSEKEEGTGGDRKDYENGRIDFQKVNVSGDRTEGWENATVSTSRVFAPA